MRFDPDYQPHKVCSSEKVRYSLTHVLVEPVPDTEPDPNTGERPARIVATDAHCMVMVPATWEDTDDDREHPDGTAMVPGEVLAEARKKKGNPAPGCVALNGTFELADGRMFPRPDDPGTFPAWRKVDVPAEREPAIRFAINPWLLVRAAAAMGKTARRSPGVVLSVYDTDSQIRVDSGEVSDDPSRPHAIVMPMRVGEPMMPDGGARYVRADDGPALREALRKLEAGEDRDRTAA